MCPDILEECPKTPKTEEEVKPEEEVKQEEEAKMEEELAKSTLEERLILGLSDGKSIFTILLQGIVRAVLEETKVRLAEEMVRFRKSMAEQLLNCSEHKMNDEVDLLKLDESFRAAWNKWMETPRDLKAAEAYKVFESCLCKPEKNDDDEDEQEAER